MKNRSLLGLLITTVNLALSGIVLVVCFILAGEVSGDSVYAPIKQTILFLCFAVVPLNLLMLITKKMLSKYVYQKQDSELTSQQKSFYKFKLSQLHRIEVTIIRLSHANTLSSNPRMSDAILKASLATMTIAVMGLAFNEVGMAYFLAVLCVVFISVAYFAFKASSAADSWIKEIDNKLAEYDPVCIAAYRHLQKTIYEDGYGEFESVRDWLLNERSTIKEVLHPDIQAARRDTSRDQDKKTREVEFVSKFLEKNIPDNEKENARDL